MDLQSEPEPAESKVNFEADEVHQIPTSKTEISDSRRLRTFKDSWRLQEMEEDGEEEHLDDPLGEDSEAVEFESVSEADVGGARKPRIINSLINSSAHFDQEQVVFEVREVFLKSKKKTLPISEICQQICEDVQKHEKGKKCKKCRKQDMKNAVEEILAKSSFFTTVGFSIWKLAVDEGTQFQDVEREMINSVNFDLEQVWCALAKLGLKVVECGNYLVIMKSEFDVMLSGEPYHALMMLFNVHTGTNCIKIGLQGKRILSKRKGLREVTLS